MEVIDIDIAAMIKRAIAQTFVSIYFHDVPSKELGQPQAEFIMKLTEAEFNAFLEAEHMVVG